MLLDGLIPGKIRVKGTTIVSPAKIVKDWFDPIPTNPPAYVASLNVVAVVELGFVRTISPVHPAFQEFELNG
jgi:hypothetical protein